MEHKRIFSGIQPTGKFHIGNYLGAIKNWVKLQDEYQCFFSVVDMHSLTADYRPSEKRQQTLVAAAELLAAGINPDKSAIFVQSQVPEHAELAWYFSTITPIAFLGRMTQYKEKAARQKTNINAGLFNYPILQAADIMLYKPYGVPVGEDQLQHLELANDIAKKFNRKFGPTFTPVKPLLTEVPRVMSLLEPNKKMSKTLGDNHIINLFDSAQTIEKKLAKAVTDTGKGGRISTGVKNLFALLEIFGGEEQLEFYKEAHREGTIRYKDLKANLAKLIAHEFTQYRERRAELDARPDIVTDVLAEGREKAQSIAAQTLSEVKEKMGLVV